MNSGLKPYIITHIFETQTKNHDYCQKNIC